MLYLYIKYWKNTLPCDLAKNDKTESSGPAKTGLKKFRHVMALEKNL
jgi:hypothetical protein